MCLDFPASLLYDPRVRVVAPPPPTVTHVYEVVEPARSWYGRLLYRLPGYLPRSSVPTYPAPQAHVPAGTRAFARPDVNIARPNANVDRRVSNVADVNPAFGRSAVAPQPARGVASHQPSRHAEPVQARTIHGRVVPGSGRR
jgi:hypothetical protein